MILYVFHMFLYGFLCDFIWFLYEFWGCGRNFRMTRFSEFERFSGFWTFDRKFQVPPKFSDDPFFWIWTFYISLYMVFYCFTYIMTRAFRLPPSKPPARWPACWQPKPPTFAPLMRTPRVRWASPGRSIANPLGIPPRRSCSNTLHSGSLTYICWPSTRHIGSEL